MYVDSSHGWKVGTLDAVIEFIAERRPTWMVIKSGSVRVDASFLVHFKDAGEVRRYIATLFSRHEPIETTCDVCGTPWTHDAWVDGGERCCEGD